MAYDTDALLSTTAFRKLRLYWINEAKPCSKCGCRINYTRGYKGPDAFELGHILGRAEARRLGWKDEQINALSNTQPECRTCNRSDGARYVNRLKAAKANRQQRVALEADEW